MSLTLSYMILVVLGIGDDDFFQFTAPDGAVLATNTKYFLVIIGNSDTQVTKLPFDGDTGFSGFVGWSIAANSLVTPKWTNSPKPLSFAVYGSFVSYTATGKPVITGTSRFNWTLGVDTAGIRDDDGVPDSFRYQWVRVDGVTETDISGATGSNYTVAFADVGRKLKVKVRFVDNAGHSEGPLVSDAREVPIPALVPVGSSVKLVRNLDQPDRYGVQISGSGAASQEFTVGSNFYFLDKVKLIFASGTTNDTPEVAIYQGSSRLYTLTGRFVPDYSGLTAPPNSILKSNTVYSIRAFKGTNPYFLQVVNSDAEDPGAADGWSIADDSLYRHSGGNTLDPRTYSFVMEVYGRGVGWPDVVVSFDEAEYRVFEGGPPVDVVVRLDKDPGRTVTIPIVAMPGGGAVEGDYSLSESVVFRSGETSKTFSVTANQDVDQNDESVVLGFGAVLPDGVSVGSVSGEMVELLDDEAPNRPATGVVNVTGLVAVGHNLVANLSGVSDPDGLEDSVYFYQWVRVDGGTETDISGANGSNYTVAFVDVGRKLKVKVSFEDYRSNLESFESVGVLVPEVALASSGVIFVPSNWSLVPEVLRSSVGSKFRLLFVSSGVRDARSSDIGSYNAFVTGVAEFGHAALRERHYFGHFRALASTSGVSAISNTDTGYSSSSLGVPIYWFGHRGRAAHDYREFYDGTPWRKGSGQNELGEAVAFTSADFIWTGTTNRGVSHGSPLGSSTPIVGRPGHSSGTQQFESQVKPSNDQLFPLYGLSMVFEVANYSRNSPAVGKPTIEGSAVVVGEILAVGSSGVTDGDGIPDSFDYQWVRVDGGTETDISGATLDTYILVADDVGKRLKVGVRFVDQWGSLEGPLVSDATGIVRLADGNAPANGKPVITGTSRLNQTLAVDTSGISDGDGVPDSFVYQWVRVDGGTETDISGATGSTYVLVADDVGKRLKVEVSFTDDGGFSEGPLVSDATSTVLSSANSPPVFSNSSSFSVNENDVNVGTVVASDEDGKDSVVNYVVSGGVDRSLFSVTSGGVLTFNSAPNFEVPGDSDGDNEYVVEVEATSGTDGRVMNATQSIVVTVTNVAEAPLRPSAPVLSSPLSTSLRVTWSLPGNTGPSIIDYDVGYGQNSSGPFTDWPHSDASRSVTITGLNASTLYYVRVRAGNAEGDSGWSEVSNFTTRSVSPPPPPPTNNPPAFTSSPTFSVNENVRGVGTVVASDVDGLDSVVGYSVSGGVDSARFSITDIGVLTFVSTPNYESPSDSDSNNVYVADVTVTSGAGSRVMNATQSITVTVNDVDEAPSRPLAPFLSSPLSTSLRVTWSLPSTAGPAISDYDVQYRQGTSGSFSNWSHSGTGRTATITSLSVNTLYEVRVRAINAEGNSSWSEVSSFTTGSIQPPPPPPQINNPPVFTSDSTFSVNENVRGVGTVVASDRDTQDSVTDYRVSGGVDSAHFSITRGGVLSFNSVPDHEVPHDGGADNVYVIQVTVTSGSGLRGLSATQNISVTVVDVVELPSKVSSVIFYSSTFDSLDFLWFVSGASGPAVSGYDVQYGLNSSGPFTNWSHSGVGRSATISGLNASTLYYVRIRVRNDDGVGVWSDVFSASTKSGGPPPVVNSPPVFTTGNFSVGENNVSVGTVVASDVDGEDSVVNYVVSGGVDGSLFSVTSGGVLTFVSAPDFESPSDSDSNNVYVADVTVISGSGIRVMDATQSIVVTVTDVDEAPSAPSAPVLSSPSSTSLLVSWSAPSNTGPAISDYDVQYRQGTSGSFTDWSHSGTGRTATITSLSANTLYQVQVRARNDEGNSSWSETASFTTGSIQPPPPPPPPQINNPPAFTSDPTFSVSGNTAIVGTVVASDSDTEDSVTGYSISGGSDEALFSIADSGVLSFVSAPDFGNPGDSDRNNDYVVEITVTSGTAGRVMSAVRIFTVEVTRILHGTRLPNQELMISSPAALSICSDGGIMYALHGSTDSITAYSLSRKTSVSSAFYGFQNLSDGSRSIWCDSLTMWVGNRLNPRRIVAYFKSNKSSDASNSFNVDRGPRNLYSDGTTMWLLGLSGGSDSIIAYTISNGSRDSGKDLSDTVLHGALNHDPSGIWSDGRTMWVSDFSDDKIYAYNMSNKSRDSSKDITLYSANGRPYDIWSDGRTMWVLDFDDSKLYAYRIYTSVNVPATGKPLIDGLLQLGQTLSANASLIRDSDGLSSVNFAYQWVRVDGGTETDISGATGSTYVLVADDAGKSLKVEVSFTDDGGFSEGPLVSDATSTVLSSANSPPAFTSSPTFSVNENVRGVGTVVASDSDTEDSVTGYNVSGGVDRSLFSITNSGVLSFRSAPNYENPQDGGTNNVYVLVVTATSGTGSRVRTATESITVTVGDVSEPPSRPSAPVLSSPSSTSLLVTWSAPGGTGPSIIDYDVGYGRNSNGPFTDWPHSSAGRSATITGLNASTLYYVRVRASNAEGNSSWSEVSNFTTRSVSPPPPPPTNNPPAFTSSPTFSMDENTFRVGTVVASDSDGEDSVTGYSVSGGVDGSLFSVTSGGVLTFNSAPNFEVPGDSDGDNEYVVEVEATSGTGSRVMDATQSIVVTVTDVDEAPSVPSAPVLSSPSSTSLSVSWSEPSNTGPAISDYDVGYGRNLNGPFTDWPHSDVSRTATITGLNASTLYYVRVRAGNADGNSSWSPTANFTTGSTSVTNNPPVFSSGSSFSVNENLLSVGVVVASDNDSGDSVSGYRVSGGVDSARFSITSGGVLTFNSAPDYEAPADSGGNNVYNFVVTASSGAGGRVRTATQGITVTVNDVAESVSVTPPQDVVLVYRCV